MKTAKLYNLFAIHSGDLPFIPGMEILNDHEPLSSTDSPSPTNANFYQGDDHNYYHVNGFWKRSPITTFINKKD